MTVKEKLAELIKNLPRVTVLPKGAIILTKEELAALKDYPKKYRLGGKPNEK